MEREREREVDERGKGGGVIAEECSCGGGGGGGGCVHQEVTLMTNIYTCMHTYATFPLIHYRLFQSTYRKSIENICLLMQKQAKLYKTKISTAQSSEERRIHIYVCILFV